MRLIDFLCECREVIEEDKERKKKQPTVSKPKMNYRPKRHSRR